MSAEVTPSLGIYALDVGQGDATLLLLPDDTAILLDCHDDHVVTQVLNNWGVTRLRAVIISHLDIDHIRGALAFLKGWEDAERTLDALYLSADRSITDASAGAATAKKLLDHALDRHRAGAFTLYPSVRSPQPIAAAPDNAWKIELLAPEHADALERERRGGWEDPNTASAVLRIEAAQRVVWLGADAPLRTWARLAERAPLQANLFRIPHHGGALTDGGVPTGWDSARLYREIGMAQAVVSVGTRNPHNHPAPDWIAPLCGAACRLLCTQVTERCHRDVQQDAKQQLDLLQRRLGDRHFIEPPWRHYTDPNRQRSRRRGEVPCAGTVLMCLYLDGRPPEVYPDTSSHDEVIALWAHPLCRTPASAPASAP